MNICIIWAEIKAFTFVEVIFGSAQQFKYHVTPGACGFPQVKD